MMAPTSVSSRLSANPVMPFPKSSISLSIASVRPSILATPSPISRTIPTFCLEAPVLTPAICASISCNNVLMFLSCWLRIDQISSLKTLFQCGQARLDAPVVNVTAHLDTHAPDQRRILHKGDVQACPVDTAQRGLNRSLQVRAERHCALDSGAALIQIQFHQALKMREDGEVTARLGGDDLLHGLANSIIVKQTVDQATAEQFLGLAPG